MVDRNLVVLRWRHLDTLIRVRKLQEAGHGLAEIAARLVSPSPKSALHGAEPRVAEPAVSPRGRYSSWTRIEIADGVELHLRGVRLDSRQVRSVGEALRGIIRQGGRR